MTPEQQQVIRDIKVEYSTYSDYYGHDFFAYLSHLWAAKGLVNIFGSRENFLRCLGFTKEQICKR